MADNNINCNSCLDLIFCACYRLKLDIEVASVALTFFQKYARADLLKGVSKEEAQLVVTTCLFLASKTEENPRRLRDVINVTHKLTWENEMSMSGSISTTSNDTGASGGGTMCLDNDYLLMKEKVIVMEQKLLRCIGFDLEIGHPFSFLLHFTKFLNLPQDIVQRAWVVLVDSLWLPESAFTKHEVLASTAIFIALTSNINESKSDIMLVGNPWLIASRRNGNSKMANIKATTKVGPVSNSLKQELIEGQNGEFKVPPTAWWHSFGVGDEELASTCELVLELLKTKLQERENREA